MKIVSLLPSATEIICLLGLGDQLVGVTHECDYPENVKSLPKVTRTRIPGDVSSQDIDRLVNEHLQENLALYSLRMDVLQELQPDIIITQALCDVCAVAETEVRDAACNLPGNPRIINLEPMSLEDVYETLLLVGDNCERSKTAQTVVTQLRKREQLVRQRTAEQIPLSQRPRVGFFEWIDPPFNAGHWTPELIDDAGGIDVLGNLNKPSETTAWQKVIDSRPDVMFIACCGFSIERTLKDVDLLTQYPGWNSLPCVIKKRVYITDGNAYFSRSGPRLIDSLEILAHALHPSVHPLPNHLEAAVSYL